MTTLTRSRGEMTYRTGVVLVLLAGVAWSTMGLGIRYIEVASVWQILFYRSLALVPFLWLVILLLSGRNPLAVIREAGLSGVLGGAGLVVAFTGGIYSIQVTTVANAVFLFSAAPFFAAVLGLWLLGESVRKGTWIAIAFAAVGVFVMVWGGLTLGRWEGNAAALASALGAALFTVTLRWKKSAEMMPAAFMGGVFAILVSGTVCLTLDLPFAIPARDISISLAMGVFQVGAGLALYTLGSRVVPAGELSLLSMGEVVLGPLWVWIILGETVSIYTLVGGAILLAALAGNALSGLRRKPPPVALG